MLKSICIIPARGGSKRIPRKNIRVFLGKPIIAYSIKAALDSGLFATVMVSTDDQEIAEISRDFGAQTPFMRSAKSSDDFATTIDVVKEVLTKYQEQGLHFDAVCVIYPTAPFVNVARLKEGFEKLSDFGGSMPVTEFSFPILRSFKISNHRLSYQWPEHEKSRSQDLEKFYHDAGQWYWIKTAILKDSLVTNNTAAVVLKNIEVQDIDQEEDWRIAELKYEYLQSIR